MYLCNVFLMCILLLLVTTIFYQYHSYMSIISLHFFLNFCCISNEISGKFLGNFQKLLTYICLIFSNLHNFFECLHFIKYILSHTITSPFLRHTTFCWIMYLYFTFFNLFKQKEKCRFSYIFMLEKTTFLLSHKHNMVC